MRFPVPTFRLVRETPGEYRSHPICDSAEAAVAILAPLREETVECFAVIFLDARLRAQGVAVIARGTLTACLIHPREVFAPAIAAHAAQIIVAHNHPSGDPSPSDEDVTLTARLVEAGEVLGIPVVDSLVLGDGFKRIPCTRRIRAK